MINLYFGLPGTGKTTLIAKLCHSRSFRKRYKNVYCNVHLANTDYTFIDNSYIGKYHLVDGAIIIDEGTLFADNRDYKNFSQNLTKFFMLHRHYNVDIYIFAQTYNGVDKKIRTLCNNVYYMYKPFLTGLWLTKYYRIPYGIVIPDSRRNKEKTGNTLGEIEEGYCKPPLIMRVFAKRLYRPKYYKYFDSWESPELLPLPTQAYKNLLLKFKALILPYVHVDYDLHARTHTQFYRVVCTPLVNLTLQ